ncbi:MAG: RibD family protein [Flavobacteriales bacterium]|nr:RibD family protein [Flavobacteriales bacterium]
MMRIINVMGASLDGRIASHPNESDADRKQSGFTNEVDHDHVVALVKTCDAVVVGGHSVNVSGGVMEVVNEQGRNPTWVVCSNRGFEKDEPIWNFPRTPKWIVSKTELPQVMVDQADQHIVYGDQGLVESALNACRDAGFKRVLLFGGGQVNRAFYAAGAVDELILSVCPVLVGCSSGVPIVAPELDVPVQFELKNVQQDGDLVFLHYLVKR